MGEDRDADGSSRCRPIGGEILSAQEAGQRRGAAHGGDDVRRDFAGVEAIGTRRRYAPQRHGERGVAEHVALSFRRTAITAEQRLHVVAPANSLRASRQQACHARRHAEAAIGSCGGVLEQLGPRQPPVPTVQQFKCPERAWNPDGAASMPGVGAIDLPAGVIAVQLGRERGRGC